MNARGMFFTVGVILLVVPLILFVAYYSVVSQTKTQDTISKIRCDELHYFVEDIRSDLERALVIFGRRAAIYAINDIVTSGRTLGGYQFNCTATCHVDCGSFRIDQNGSEAALAELSLCGTLHGQNIPYMTNHTLGQWIDRIELHGGEMHFRTNITMTHLAVAQSGPWDFVLRTNSSFDVYDESGTCFFVGDDVATSSSTSILGLEDPTFPLNTNSYIVRFIDNCSVDIRTQELAGCSGDSDEPGMGQASGSVVFDSSIDAATYCQSTSPDEINNQILVLDRGFGSCNSYNAMCFNLSHPNHFAGVIDYGGNSPGSFVKKCNVTIPWMRDTGDIDDEPPRSPPRRVPECGQADISEGSCIQLKNNNVCGLHQIILGCSSSKVNTTCYQQSNASLYPNGIDGPSFFDRLDGSPYLSPNYANQSLRLFNVSRIGIETLVDPFYLDVHGVKVFANATWVDYLYWNGTYGCEALGVCPQDRYTLRFDDIHSKVYKTDTACVNATGCGQEICVNGIDEDRDGMPDWLDPDCIPYFSAAGTIKACDLDDTHMCLSCDDPAPTQIAENTTLFAAHYGYNTTEWHFYSIQPSQEGMLYVTFNGTSNASGAEKTSLVFYNYSNGGCAANTLTTSSLEPNRQMTYCVESGKTYVFGLDVNVPGYGYNGTYLFGAYLSGNDPLCKTSTTTTSSIVSSTTLSGSTSSTITTSFTTSTTVSTTITATSTTTSTTTTSSTATSTTTTTTTTTVPCGFFDNMESSSNGWTSGGANNDWARGNPQWRSSDSKRAYSGTRCWATDINGNYNNNEDAYLMSPVIHLEPATSPLLAFFVKYDIEYADKGYVEASSDGTNWGQLAFYNNTADDRYQDGWILQTFNLNTYRGGDFWVRFRLQSDATVTKRGLYVDDVNVTCY